MADSALTERRAATKLTPAVLTALLDRVANGVPFTTAAIAAGIPFKTASQWEMLASRGSTTWPDGSPIADGTRRFLAALAEQIAHAEAVFEAKVVENVSEAGYMVGKNGLRDWRAHMELLTHAPQYRQKYREARELKVEHSGQVNHQHRLASKMSDDDLLEIAPAEWREMVPDHETVTGQIVPVEQPTFEAGASEVEHAGETLLAKE